MGFFDENKIKAAIFDLDGTLVDSMSMWRRVLPDFLDAYKIETDPDILRKVSFMTLPQSSKYVADNYPQLSMTGEEIMQVWMQNIFEHYSKNIPLRPGAKELFELLKSRGVKLAVATACNHMLAESCLENNAILNMLDNITYAEEVGTGKDKPDVYLECLRRLGCKPEEAFLFEDILIAVKTAQKIGLRTIAIEEESSAADREEIKKTAFKYIIDFRELL